MIFFWIFVIFITIGVFNCFISEKVTGNKRIVEIIKEDGSTFYRCEKETSKGHWIPIKRYISYGFDYGEYLEEVIYNNIDDALKYIGKHPSQITKLERIIEI